MDNITTIIGFDPKLLKEDFENTAEWRRIVAAEHPNDSRNTEAAEILDKLAATVDAVDPALLDAYGELFEDCAIGEAHSKMLRQIVSTVGHPARRSSSKRSLPVKRL